MSNVTTIEEVVERTGLSRFNLDVYAAVANKKNPLKINTLFRVICPNREIRSLCPDTTAATVSTSPTKKGTATTTATTKKNEDEIRRIIKERDGELTEHGIKIAGTINTKKSLTAVQKDLQLRWEFLGWGATASDFYVFLYYVGPPYNPLADPVTRDNELSRHANWRIVPESHLSLFHKSMGTSYQEKLQQFSLDVKESADKRSHIQYDVRYVLYKWRTCNTPQRKEKVAFLNQYLSLFDPRDTPRIKDHKKRKQQAAATANNMNATAAKHGTKLAKSTVKPEVSVAQPDRKRSRSLVEVKEYEVKTEKYRRVMIEENQTLKRYPLGPPDSIHFDIDTLNTLIKNVKIDEDSHPSSYTFNPTESIVKPWILASSLVRLRRQLIQTLIKKHNLCFECSDLNTLYDAVRNNKKACDDVKLLHDSFTWAYTYFTILMTTVPDAVLEVM